MDFHQGDIEDEYGVWYGDGDLYDEELYDHDGGGYPKKRNTGRHINYWETSWRKLLKDLN